MRTTWNQQSLSKITILFHGTLSGYSYHELYQNIFNEYQSVLRPVKNASTSVTVELIYHLTHVDGISGRDQMMMTRGWLELSWQDELLSWNASDFSGIDSLTLPINKLWTPDIALLNDVEGNHLLSAKGGQARLSSSGRVEWNIGLVVGTTCVINVFDFPFDLQKCSLKFSQMSSGNHEVAIKPGISRFPPGDNYDEWSFVNESFSHTILEINHVEHALVNIEFTYQRKPMSFIISGIIPMVLLSVVNLGSFILPPGSEEKVSVGVSVLLSFYVFVSVINSLLPDVSDRISIFRLYVVIHLTLKVMTTLSSVIILHFYYKPTSKPLPRWLQKLLLAICRKSQAVHPNLQQEQLDTNQLRDSSDDSDIHQQGMEFVEQENLDSCQILRSKRSPDWKMVAETLNTVCFITFSVLTLSVNIICFCVMII
ncbi:neuronal acetylcholine receptor subunit alpha-6-like [Gigantopelta aegis]|uniref:neuronal acetylcholine receptor subunit alpha-6-like n=1 Tax=Gigantopelta aegis TaxID=1735272 RepID=UPI001B888545|nr:neuronal acetylcholine receptor subunit alpha-6-like [Gigantopelta aegis]